MLDLVPSTGEVIETDILKMLEIAITNALFTPFESRVFNPGLGTNAVNMLQEPTNDVISLAHMQSLIISAIHRAIPEVTISISVSSISSGRGTSEVRIKMNISFNGSSYQKEYSSLLRGFTN